MKTTKSSGKMEFLIAPSESCMTRRVCRDIEEE